MHLLDAPSLRDEVAGEPVKQRGVRRCLTVSAKITRCRNDRLSEVVLPDPIHHDAGG